MLCWFIDKLMMDYTWSTYICTSPIATGMPNRLYKAYLYCPQLDDLRLLETIISFIIPKYTLKTWTTFYYVSQRNHWWFSYCQECVLKEFTYENWM